MTVGTLTINNSTLSDNSAYSGGGIYNHHSGLSGDAGVLTVNNSTLSRNVATNSGGGIYNDIWLTVNNSTLNSNSANSGGGIYSSYALYLQNTILSNSPNGGDCYKSDTFDMNLNNLIEDGSCNNNATGFITGDPHLGPLQDNGGPTPTHALLPGSPAIDAGDNTTCLATDQRNIPRPLDGNDDGTATCDIGAFEVDPSTPTVQFTQPAYTVSEGIGLSQSVVLTRTGNLSNPSQIRVSLNGGTASPGPDYLNATFPLTLTFGSGVVSQTVPVTLVDDTLIEPTETISLTLTSINNAVIGARNKAVLQIEDNDAENSPPTGVYLPLVIK